jgi:hypothetical protein
MVQRVNFRKLAFGCPSLLSAGFTLFITYEYFTGFLPGFYQVRKISTPQKINLTVV